MRPAGLLGLLGAPIAMSVVARRSFDAAFRRYDALASRPSAASDASERPRLAPGGEARLAALQRQLAEVVGPPDLIARLQV